MSLTTYISPRHTTAYISVIVFIWVPVTAYCDYRSLFGNWPLVKLLVFAGAGGALSFVLFAEAKDRVLAMVAGLCRWHWGRLSLYLLSCSFKSLRQFRIAPVVYVSRHRSSAWFPAHMVIQE